MEIIVHKIDKPARLDLYLAEIDKEKSRSQWQKLAKAGAILVNGKIATPHLTVHTGDEIIIEKRETRNEKRESAKISIEILANEPDYFVINKPSGLASDEPKGFKGQSIGPILAECHPLLTAVPDFGLVHRLDAEASGCLLIAKNEQSQNYLHTKFHDREIHKYYLVLVSGHVKWDEHTADFAIGRSSAGYKMAARPKPNEQSKEAQTIFYTLARAQKMYSLVLAKTLTGRTHQVRVHAKALGHPVAGDKIYNPRWKPGVKHNVILNRLFLHCLGLEIPWPKYGLSGNLKVLEKRFYTSPLPQDLGEVLTALKINKKEIEKKLTELEDKLANVEIM